VKTLIVCEDPLHDRYIAKPVVRAVLAGLGSQSSVDVLTDPRTRGIDDLVAQSSRVLAERPMIDLFVFIADRDCQRTGDNKQRLRDALRPIPSNAVICCAVEELETWLLALHRGNLPESFPPWAEIQQHCDPKEHFATPFLSEQGFGGPGDGRAIAMKVLNQTKLRDLMRVCDEVRELRDDISRVLSTR
jgi:hypothetical protein